MLSLYLREYQEYVCGFFFLFFFKQLLASVDLGKGVLFAASIRTVCLGHEDYDFILFSDF